jgi:hypothetical protein
MILKLELVKATEAELRTLAAAMTGNDNDAVLAAEHALIERTDLDIEIELGTVLEIAGRGREDEAAQLLEAINR